MRNIGTKSHAKPGGGGSADRSARDLEKELRRSAAAGLDDTQLLELAATWGGRAERRYRAAQAFPPCQRARLETLSAAGLIERGLAIACAECTIRSFLPLPTTTPQPACPACGAPQHYIGDGVPSIHYRLHALVDRAADQGILPHVIAAAVIGRTAAAGSTHLLTGTDLPTLGREVDLYGVTGGLVVAGEVKTSPAQELCKARNLKLMVIEAGHVRMLQADQSRGTAKISPKPAAGRRGCRSTPPQAPGFVSGVTGRSEARLPDRAPRSDDGPVPLDVGL